MAVVDCSRFEGGSEGDAPLLRKDATCMCETIPTVVLADGSTVIGYGETICHATQKDAESRSPRAFDDHAASDSVVRLYG